VSRISQYWEEHVGFDDRVGKQHGKTESRMKTTYTTYESPLGMIRMLASDQGLLRLEFEDERESLMFRGARRDGDYFEPFTEQLSAYFAGELREFSLPIALEGSAFQRRVWKALCEIPYGETRSYGDIARAVGNPRAARAVGTANRSNPVAIIIPCHRVIGSSGKLVGYGGGLWRKEALLEAERHFLALGKQPVSVKAS
jgi:methylated-DNA-[protein]-cysteine S-methyltransferase